MTDLQPERCKIADLLLFRRNDARQLNDGITQPLLAKFDFVHQRRCRRMNATGYPQGCNEMFYDLLEMIRAEEWKQNYFAFLNLETDCVPLNPNWIQILSDEYKQLNIQGATAVGHVCEGPVEHLNGCAMYSIDFWETAGQLDLIGGPANVAYDIQKRGNIMPHAKDTPLMLLDFNRKTISASDLFGLTKAGVKPVFFHGTKDESARIAVRAFFIEKKGLKDLANRTISTFCEVVPGINNAEQKHCIDIWRDTWQAAGWNTVVNTLYDALKHPLYKQIVDKSSRMPSVNPPGYDLACYLRWLAFDYQGGGVHSDYDVLPRRKFSPERFPIIQGFTCMQYRNRDGGEVVVPSLVSSDREGLKTWIQYILDTPEIGDHLINGKPHMSDMYVLNRALKEPWLKRQDLCRDVGEDGWMESHAVHFSHGACTKYSPGTPKSLVMLQFVRSVESA
jgi:hypothetical protein